MVGDRHCWLAVGGAVVGEREDGYGVRLEQATMLFQYGKPRRLVEH